MIFLYAENEKSLISQKWCEIEISMKYLAHRVSAESTGGFPKNRFPAILAAMLNFCVKRKNAFILGTVLDRAISTNF